ncbi:MAG: hypothetical protein LYZ69_08830 [Nitrososphaerales archaeon]|nr:hypothetical protein [Nitrososphaerales archaeon]
MKVSILIFPGVEELDFVGFLEVLAVANRTVGRRHFDTELGGTEKGPFKCSGGLKVVPDRTLADYIAENTKLKVEHDGNETVTIHLEQKNDAMIALGAIAESGIHWDTLSTRRDSLEDIFVRMVGEDINEQGELVRPK